MVGYSRAFIGFGSYVSDADPEPATTDLKDVLVNHGLLTDGGASPLNTDDGQITAGDINCTVLSATEASTISTTTAVTTAVRNALTISHLSSGTPAAGFGPGLSLTGESSTTADRTMGRVASAWNDATDASRAADTYVAAYYRTTEREGVRVRATSSTVQLGFYGVTPVSQHSSTGSTAGFTAGVGTVVRADATFTGGSGTKAYTIDDAILALKNAGLMAAS